MIAVQQHTGEVAPAGKSAATEPKQSEADAPRTERAATGVGQTERTERTERAATGVAETAPEGILRNRVETNGLRVDTAAGCIGTDTLRIAGDSTAFAADSLQAGKPDSLPFGGFGSDLSAIPAERPVTPSPWRDTTVTALFGEQSVTIQPERLERPLSSPLTDNAVFQSFVLLLAATYATLLYRNLGDIRSLLNRISRDKTSGERLSEEPGSSGFARFLNLTTAIGILFMGVVVVKYGDSLMPPGLGRSLSHGAVLALSLLATLAWGIVILFQAAVVRIIGAVTLSQPFIAQLVQLRQTFFSLAVIIASPALLLFALCPRGTGSVWFFVGAAELIITAVLYLKESLNLFISKKISILHWFLYLCTVEIFPISLLWLLAAR